MSLKLCYWFVMAMVGHHEGDTFVDDRDVVCGVNC